MAHLLTSWFGAFVVEGTRVLRAYPAPGDPAALAERLARRRDGRLTPEETRLLEENPAGGLTTRDRRLLPFGVRFQTVKEPALDPTAYGLSPAVHRKLLLDAALTDLSRAWDPSVHVQDAVRAIEELEEISNRIAERLESWSDRLELTDAPTGAEVSDSDSHPDALARVTHSDPELAQGRNELDELHRAVKRTSRGLEHALDTALPRRAPNLCELLGPRLAARMISQAGGLDRLARLPASTIQVLGAEKAFFEHLRGRAPPPRHGLLFLHPKLHSAPRVQRGRLARALAGKVAIAARLDRAGAAVRPELKRTFEKRAEAIGKQRVRADRRGRPELRLPFDRAAEDR
jgi:nucleolar protein 56